MKKDALKLTKRTVEAILPQEKPFRVFDSALPGFVVRVMPSGTKTFAVLYRDRYGRQRQITIGTLSPSLTTDQARAKAVQIKRQIEDGDDPAENRKADREAVTVNELLDAYFESAAFGEKAASTQKIDRGRADRHIRPLLGGDIAKAVTSEKVKRFRCEVIEGKTAGQFKTVQRGLAKVRGGEGTANKAVLLLRAIYTWAKGQGYVSDNPASEVQVTGSNVREVVIEEAGEYGRLFSALNDMEDTLQIRPAMADAIRVLALTGLRKGEVTGMLWGWVDLPGGRLTIPARKHKAGHKTGKPKVVLLPSAVQAIIARQPEGGADEFVFRPAKDGGKGGPTVIDRAWKRVVDAAGLRGDLTPHSLRHSVGTALASSGASQVEIMAALGHRRIETSLRYIHFVESKRQNLAERAASMAIAGMNAAESMVDDETKIIDFEGKRKAS